MSHSRPRSIGCRTRRCCTGCSYMRRRARSRSLPRSPTPRRGCCGRCASRSTAEYGAFWEVDRARTSLRWVSSWQQRSADFEAFADVSRQMVVRRGTGLPGRVWAAGQPAWIPDIQQRRQLPARGHGRHASACTQRLRHADAARWRRSRRDGVLQPRDAAAGRGPGADARHHRGADWRVCRSEAFDRGTGPLLHRVAGPALHRELRRLLPPCQPGLCARAGVFRGGAARGSLHRLRAPRRSRGHARGDGVAVARRARHQLREPLPHGRRIVPSGSNGPRRRCPSRASCTRPHAT